MSESVSYDRQCKHANFFNEEVSHVSSTDRSFHREVRDECKLSQPQELLSTHAANSNLCLVFKSQ